ncbi:MAG: hypothetical protein JXA25_12045, partial [Anaerolineales bacterium]|nr:hypothetical protein [Anaerolineales bacterium]
PCPLSVIARTVEWSVETESILVWALFYYTEKKLMTKQESSYLGMDVGKDWHGTLTSRAAAHIAP